MMVDQRLRTKWWSGHLGGAGFRPRDLYFLGCFQGSSAKPNGDISYSNHNEGIENQERRKRLSLAEMIYGPGKEVVDGSRSTAHNHLTRPILSLDTSVHD